MPTDALNLFRDAALETKEMGFGRAADAAWALGDECRAMMKSKGLRTVSAPGFEGTCCAFPKSRHCLMPLFGCTTSNTTRNLYHYWQLLRTHTRRLGTEVFFSSPQRPHRSRQKHSCGYVVGKNKHRRYEGHVFTAVRFNGHRTRTGNHD